MTLKDLYEIGKEKLSSSEGDKLFNLLEPNILNTDIKLLKEEISKLQKSNIPNDKLLLNIKETQLKKALEKRLETYNLRWETFKVSGRVYDGFKIKDLKDVKIQVGNGSKLEVENTNTGLEDKAKSVLPQGNDVQIVEEMLVENNIFSNSSGLYEIDVKVLVIGDTTQNNMVSVLNPYIILEKEDFKVEHVPIINYNRRIKNEVIATPLYNQKKYSEYVAEGLKNELYKAQSKLVNIALDPIEKVINGKRRSIQKLMDLLTGKLLPLLMGILVLYGLDKTLNKSKAKCITEDELKRSIEKRNRIVRQLNQIFSAVLLNTALAGVFIALTELFKSIRFTVDGLPIPLATSPYTLVSKLQNISALLKKLEDENKELNKQLIIQLLFLTAGLILAKILLGLIDELNSKCAAEKGIKIDNVELDENLKKLGLKDEKPEEDSSVNGFYISVVFEDKKIGEIQRRQAIGKNKQGVILLKGKPSFAVDDQILIDELGFYIKINNLKAN